MDARFCILGPLEVHTPAGVLTDLGGHKSRVLLTTLLLRPNAWVTMPELEAAIWPDGDSPPSAGRNIRTYVWQLRRQLPPATDGARIDSRPGAYRLVLAPGELDTGIAEQRLGDARRAIAAGQPERAAGHLLEALALWRGRPIDALGADAAARLDELHWELREALADAYRLLGRHRDAVAVLRAMVTDDPLRERHWTQLVIALHHAGRRAEALAAYRQARAVLVEELGVDPSEELTAAHEAALSGTTSVAWQPRIDLPRPVPRFVGRTAELTEPTGVMVIDGMPGVGKTAFALELARRVADRYPDGQLFVDLRTHTGSGRVDTADALGRLLRAIGTPSCRISDSVDERAADWRAALTGRRVLLILDDAATTEQIQPLLPGHPDCLVLVTSRYHLPALNGVTRSTLRPLNDTDAAELFGPHAEPDLIRHCGGLPAAIRLAAARLAQRPAWTVQRLAAELADPAGRVRVLNGSEAGLSAYGVDCLFDASYRLLGEPARRAFRLLSLLPGEPIDNGRAAAVLGTDRHSAATLLDTLLDSHLLERPSPNQYRFHPLVRDYAIRRLPDRVRSIGQSAV